MKKVISLLIISILFISGVSANEVKFNINEYDEISNLTYSANGDDLFFIHNKKPEDALKSLFGLSDDSAETQIMKNGELLGSMEEKGSISEMIISKDGKHFLLNMHGRMEMTIFKDLVPVGTYDWIDTITFFDNDKSIIYKAKKDDKEFIVKDNEELTKYDYVQNLLISEDTKHYIYIGSNIIGDNYNREYFLIRDGNIVYNSNNYIDKLKFSSDGKSYAFYEGNSFIIDGVINKIDNDDFSINRTISPIYSKNAENIYFIGRKIEGTRGNTTITSIIIKNGKEYKKKGNYKNNIKILNKGILWRTHSSTGETRLLLDEKELFNFFSIDEPIYNEMTGKIAFIGKETYKGEYFIINDGKRLNFDGYKSISKLTYSKNGDSLAFTTRKLNEQGVYFIFNGNESLKFDNIYDIVLSDDGKRYAFLGEKNSKNYLIVDGIESEGYERIQQNQSYENRINTSATNKNISVVFEHNHKSILVETEFNTIIKKSNPKLDIALNKFFYKIEKKGKDKANTAYKKILSKIDTIILKSDNEKTKKLLEYIKDKISEKIK